MNQLENVMLEGAEEVAGINPWVWVGALLLAIALFGAGAKIGYNYEHNAAVAREKAADAKAAEHLAVVTAKAATDERDLRAKWDVIEKTYKEKQNADQAEIVRLNGDLATGRKRLRFAGTCSGHPEAADTATGDREETVELAPAASQFLVGLVSEGDAGIDDLNKCIDKYEAVRQKYNQP